MSELAATVGALLVAALVAFFAGQRTGELKQRRRDADALRRAEEIEDEVEAMDDGAVGRELRRWMRD